MTCGILGRFISTSVNITLIVIVFALFTGGVIEHDRQLTRVQLRGLVGFAHTLVWIVYALFLRKSVVCYRLFLLYGFSTATHLGYIRSPMVGFVTALAFWYAHNAMIRVLGGGASSSSGSSAILSPGGSPMRLRKHKQQRDHPMPLSSGMTVLLEGNICAGKTEFMRTVESFRSRNVVVHYEMLVRGLHAAFVKDPLKYGFALQMLMCERRCYMLSRAIASVNQQTNKTVFLDRSLVGDYAFAAWNYIVGDISEAEFAMYQVQYGVVPSLMLQNALRNGGKKIVIVYLHAPARVCKERLDSRPGADQNTSLRYLMGISLMHICALINVYTSFRQNKVAIALFESGQRRLTNEAELEHVLESTSHVREPDCCWWKTEDELREELVLGAAEDARFNTVLKSLFYQQKHAVLMALRPSDADNVYSEARGMAFLVKLLTEHK